MPYLPTEERKAELRKLRLEDVGRACETDGELNFSLTELMTGYAAAGGRRYHSVKDVVGETVCAVLEFYRRVGGPYEDEKIEQNGDVYPAALLPSRDVLKQMMREVWAEMRTEDPSLSRRARLLHRHRGTEKEVGS